MDIYTLDLFIEHSGEHWWERNILCSFITPQAFWQSSAPVPLRTLVTFVVLYSLTRATMMSPGNDETRVCRYICSEFIHWALWEYRWEQNIFCSFTTPQVFWQRSAPGDLSTLVTSVVLYWLTWATLMSPGKDVTRVCGYRRSEFIHWALWRTLMRTEYFLFVHHTTSILAKLSTWCLSTLVTSVVLYSLTQAALMSRGKNETFVYMFIYIPGYYLSSTSLIHINFLRWKKPWFCYLLLFSIAI